MTETQQFFFWAGVVFMGLLVVAAIVLSAWAYFTVLEVMQVSAQVRRNIEKKKAEDAQLEAVRVAQEQLQLNEVHRELRFRVRRVEEFLGMGPPEPRIRQKPVPPATGRTLNGELKRQYCRGPYA